VRIIVLGALGEVGSSVSGALLDLGHEVVSVSARAPLSSYPDAVTFESALAAISGREADLVLNCSGRGDRRASDRSGVDATDYLAAATAAAGIPGVLLSTTRVLEGYTEDFSESAEPRATTPYAKANAENEARWLADGAPAMHVLRITNYFSAPQRPDSPQALLLPWSLVTEALDKGSIGLRSGASLIKEFVSADDVATAVTLLASNSAAPRICATVPGAAFSLQDLAEACLSALRSVGRGGVEVTYGPDGPPGVACLPGWLATSGWRGQLTEELIAEAIASWLLREGLGTSTA
jgi:nucleoside-diphosphate-sugar epimerase